MLHVTTTYLNYIKYQESYQILNALAWNFGVVYNKHLLVSPNGWNQGVTPQTFPYSKHSLMAMTWGMNQGSKSEEVWSLPVPASGAAKSLQYS